MSFFTWLELNGYSKQEQTNIADKLEYEKNFVNNEWCLLYEYILDECEKIATGDRESRKQECKALYNHLKKKTVMKNSEIVKTIAAKMKVKPDCIRVYLRELFNGDKKNSK